jgi:hypothetical protein
MIESMQKEIDKRFLKGIAASPGIVIGKPLRFVWSTARSRLNSRVPATNLHDFF